LGVLTACYWRSTPWWFGSLIGSHARSLTCYGRLKPSARSGSNLCPIPRPSIRAPLSGK